MAIIQSRKDDSQTFQKFCNGLSLVLLVTVWWGATAWNSVAAKQVAKQNALAVPWMAFTSNLLGGIGYMLLYFYDKSLLTAFVPPSTLKSTFLPLALAHGVGVLAAYMGLIGARVSLVQAVKAMEPLLAMVLTVCFSRQYPSGGFLLAAVIVTVGVMTVCVADTTYTWMALSWGVASSLFTQSRNQYMKRQQRALQDISTAAATTNMYGGQSETNNGHGHQHNSAANKMALLSPQLKGLIMFVIVSAYALPINAILAIIFTVFPPSKISSNDEASLLYMSGDVFKSMVKASLTHFAYNCASFGVLALVSPPTHSVANTSKRAVVIGSAAVFLTETPTEKTLMGLVMTVGGSVLYAIEQQKEKQRQAAAAKEGGKEGGPPPSSSSNARNILFVFLIILFAFGIFDQIMNVQTVKESFADVHKVEKSLLLNTQVKNDKIIVDDEAAQAEEELDDTETTTAVIRPSYNKGGPVGNEGRSCIYYHVLSCMRQKDAYKTQAFTLRQLDTSVDACVQIWYSNEKAPSDPWFSGNDNNFPFNILGRGGLKDRVDWSVFRLGLTKEADANLKYGCIKPANDNNHQAVLNVPEWWNSVDALPAISRRYLTGGSYLPPFYDEPDEQQMLSKGFILPKGPIRPQKSSIEEGKFRANVWVGSLNLGDCYNFYLLSLLSGKNVQKNKLGKMLCAVGSIAGAKCDVVWGSGKIDNSPAKGTLTKEVYAMRGPDTRSFFPSLLPEVYGDPGLLVPLLHPLPSHEKNETVDLCLIPHYIDQNLPPIKDAIRRVGNTTVTIRLINIQTCDLQNYITDMKGCKRILSSSLHGLIFGVANGIPGIRMILSDKVHGNHFKFKDFYKGIRHPELYVYEDLRGITELPFETMISVFERKNVTAPAINVEDLWNVNPVHAEAMGTSREDHVAFAQSYITNLAQEYPHPAYKKLYLKSDGKVGALR